MLFSALLLVAAGAWAQDTVHSAWPDSNYYYTTWIDSEEVIVTAMGMTDGYLLMGKYFFTDDSLKVYGIAAALVPEPYGPFADSTFKNSYEYIGLYKHLHDTLGCTGDTLLTVSDSLLFSVNRQPDHYFYIDMPTYFASFEKLDVYEQYFDTPVAVADSFYVCMTHRSYGQEMYAPDTNFPDSLVSTGRLLNPYLNVGAYMYTNPHATPESVVFVYTMNGEVRYKWWGPNGFGPGSTMGYYCEWFMFPIMTPPDTTHVDPIVDTTVVDTTVVDTLGIVPAQMLQRYVNVMPNPAAERVQVTSSFGLREISVYNAAGVRVMEQKATGYAATLDVSALPEGAYLVRIATPSGTTTKKLLVRRQ